MQADALPRPTGAPTTDPRDQRIAELEATVRRLREGGVLKRLHRRFCLLLDRLMPRGTKTITFAAIQAAIAAGPTAMAGVWPFSALPVETRDWLFHLMTTNPVWWFVVVLLVLYLNICARNVIDYREEEKRETA